MAKYLEDFKRDDSYIVNKNKFGFISFVDKRICPQFLYKELANPIRSEILPKEASAFLEHDKKEKGRLEI